MAGLSDELENLLMIKNYRYTYILRTAQMEPEKTAVPDPKFRNPRGGKFKIN